MGPEGGTFNFAQGNVTLVFPAGAVSEDVSVTVEPTSGFPDASTVVDGAVYEFGPDEIEFAEPVGLTIRYALPGLAPGVEEAELALYKVTDGVWEEVPESDVDVAGKAVAAAIDGFSVLGVLGTPVASLALTPDTATVPVGDALQLVATTKDSQGRELPSRPIAWTSSDDDIATVDEAGRVTAVALGEATVTAASEGHIAMATLTIVNGFLALELVADVDDPVFVTAAPGDLERLFILERAGTIRIIRDGALLSTPFLDIWSLVSVLSDGGLLGLAFHPDYAQTGEFFLHYTAVNDETRVVRYRVSGDPDVADAGTAEIMFALEPARAAIHAGGTLAFGPDGMLYISFGDGGASENAQDLSNLFGTILRIDVDGGAPYGVPGDNPFVGVAGARDEIWAYGFRQPFRFSFDRETGDLYVGDVGESRWEEVNVQLGASGGGENYGWPTMEGSVCFEPPTCDPTGLVLPTLEYSHAEGAVVIGGYVYNGSAISLLEGHYIYADHGRGWVRSFRYGGGQAVDLQDWSVDLELPVWAISSFGEDAAGELYITVLTTPDENGKVYRIVPGPKCCN